MWPYAPIWSYRVFPTDRPGFLFLNNKTDIVVLGMAGYSRTYLVITNVELVVFPVIADLK